MTNHFHEAEKILAELDAFQASLPRGAAIDPDEYEEAINLLTVGIGRAQVHALLAVAGANSARHVDTPPGPCPVDSLGGLRCVWRAGHAGLHSRGGTTWTHGTDRMAASLPFPAEQDGPEF